MKNKKQSPRVYGEIIKKGGIKIIPPKKSKKATI
jgi:hypothetical protein